MTDPTFNEVFGNKFDELEQKLQAKSMKVVNKKDLKEYDLYDLFLEHKSILENYYENNIKHYYINYKNFIYYFNEFLSRFKLHGFSSKFNIIAFKDHSSTDKSLMLYDDFIESFYSLIRCIEYDTNRSNDTFYLRELIEEIDRFKDYIKSDQNYKGRDSSLSILNSDDFAKIVFSYSSYSALMDSVDIYVKSIYSGKIKEILPYIETVADPSSFFTGVKCPSGRWPIPSVMVDSLSNFIQLNWWTLGLSESELAPIGAAYIKLRSNTGSIFWISESGINIVNSIMNNLIAENSENNFDLVYIKCGNKYIASVFKNGTNIDKVLDSLNLSKDTFFSNKSFPISAVGSKTEEIGNIIYKIILEKHNLILPIISSICIKKIDNVKNKYTKVLNLSAEDSDVIFKNIYDDYSIDKVFTELTNNSYGEVKRCFGNNQIIIREIIRGERPNILTLESYNKYDYLGLFKESIDHDFLYDIKEAILTADKEVDISEIFSKNIVANYSNLIKKTYENPNSIIYSDLEEIIYKNKINLNLIKKISQSINVNTPYNEDSNIIDLQTVYKKSLDLDLDLNLKILRFSSRLDFLNGRSYKEFLESEKNKTQEIEDEIAKLTDLQRGDLLSDIQKNIESKKLNVLFSKLIIDNFKKEGQLLQGNSDQELTVKIPEYSEEKKTEVFIPKNISFAKLSVLLELLNKKTVNLPSSFSEFLDNLNVHKIPWISSININSVGVPITLALFWIKKLSKPEEISSPESLERSLLSFLENLPLMMSIFDENETLQAIVSRYEDYGLYAIVDAFIKQSKFSKIETFKNLSSLIKFYHNNERVWDLPYLISDSKNLNKLYLNNYQVFLQSFIDFNYLLEYNSFGGKRLSPSELKEKIYNLKETLKNDPNIGPEKTEKLLPQDKIDGIQFFKLEKCEMLPASFDEAFDKMGGNFDPKNIASLNNIISTIKQVEAIKKYISYAKPKDELVLDNNYMFTGSNNSKFRFRTLGDIDPQHFSIGVDTNCCQRIGGAGAAAAIDSFINPASSVIILEVNNNSGWTIISQSYFHVVSEENYFILDNIEAGKYDNRSLKSMISFDFFEVYGILAKELLAKGFKKVLCGMGYTKVLMEDTSKFNIHEMDKDPRHFEVEEREIKTRYTDFRSRESFDLGSPNFEIPEVGKLVFAASIDFKTNMLLKISNSILIKKTDNLNLIKLSKYLNSVNLMNYSSRVLLLEK